MMEGWDTTPQSDGNIETVQAGLLLRIGSMLVKVGQD